jgi:UDP-3-O-[3-hydroxymyristoyl] glucosamine N-acyltransferase
MRIAEIATRAGAQLENCPSPETLEITGVAPIETASNGQIAYIGSPRDWVAAQTTRASAVILSSDSEPLPLPMLRGPVPYLIVARVLDLFHIPIAYEPGTHPTAVIHESAQIGPRASIGPYVVIDKDVQIGADAVLLSHVVIYRGARIGNRFFAHAHAVVREFCRLGDDVILQNGAVIGADGFGFARAADASDGHDMWVKLAHPGAAVLGDRVEVQANACVDRASIGETRIGRDVKIGGLAQIGHEASVGELTQICPQVGVGGATRIGSEVTLLGQVGVAGYCTIGDAVTVTGKSGVMSDVDSEQVVSGYPAMSHRRWLRSVAVFKRLPELEHALHESGVPPPRGA